ncbi:MAG: hypothetical protein IRY98_08355 [Alicyclobacillaceae bacterium]|nr:hypothetical protein [Alicyclobacillaceae bacterium]
MRLTRELHDAGAASGGGATLGWRDGSGRWVSVSLNSKGQLVQAVNGTGAVVLGNGLKSVDFVVEQGGVWIRTWWIRPWTEEPVTSFVAFRLPDGEKLP